MHRVIAKMSSYQTHCTSTLKILRLLRGCCLYEGLHQGVDVLQQVHVMIQINMCSSGLYQLSCQSPAQVIRTAHGLDMYWEPPPEQRQKMIDNGYTVNHHVLMWQVSHTVGHVSFSQVLGVHPYSLAERFSVVVVCRRHSLPGSTGLVLYPQQVRRVSSSYAPHITSRRVSATA